MSFREKLNAVAVDPASRPDAKATSSAYKVLKGRIHLKLLERFDLAALETLSQERLRQEVAAMVERLLQEEQAPVNDIERRLLIRDIQHEIAGMRSRLASSFMTKPDAPALMEQ